LLIVADHALGLPVLRALSLCTCCRQYPGAASGRRLALPPARVSLPRNGDRVGLHIDLFEVCSAFTHVAACTLALSPIRDTIIEGFSQFVTSLSAPIASGWSICRVGLAPTGKRRLSRRTPEADISRRQGLVIPSAATRPNNRMSAPTIVRKPATALRIVAETSSPVPLSRLEKIRHMTMLPATNAMKKATNPIATYIYRSGLQ
jgi:hypothetical protein